MRLYYSVFALLLSVFVLSGCIGFKWGGVPAGSDIALVEIKGLIVTPDDVIEQLEKARKNKDIKAVLVRIDSPGGSVAASQEMFHAIHNLDKEKPVFVSMGDIAASGGYYASAGARKIYASEGTVTGSIGVRMEHINASGFFDLIRLKPETLKSGEYKDIGTSFRPLTPEEREFLNGFLAEIHEQFKADVASSRGLSAEFVDEIADGKIYTGAKAKELGLIDELGGLLDAVKEVAKVAGIKGEPEIMKMRKDKPWWYDFFAENIDSILGHFGGRKTGYKYFMYEWKL